MSTLKQLQALDFLLKRMASEQNDFLKDKNFRQVVEVNGVLWKGDFYRIYRDQPCLYTFADDGDFKVDTFHITGHNVQPFLPNVWSAFASRVSRRENPFWTYPVSRVRDIPHLFQLLSEVIQSIDFEKIESPFEPILYNAQSLDGSISLPFVNLSEANLRLVSIVEA